MHSPKFPHKAPHLKKIVAASNLAKRWKQTVRDHMRKQIVPDAVEFLDFHVQLAQRCTEIEASVCSGDYAPRLSLRLKAEKSRGLCRQIVLPSPEDALVLQALSDSLWKEIRQKAPSEKSFYAPQDQAFSKQPLGESHDWGYGPIAAWLNFQETVLKFSKSYKFVVVTDITNYYDCILHNFLRAILSDYGLEKEYALDLLLYLLDSMLWRPDYMPNYGIGLPQINLDAPRLLAHTHLFEVDQLFADRPDIDFARYMDDMDFGVDSIAVAKEVLRDLDLALQTRNLRVNSGKTKILTADEALIHFRATDNAIVDELRHRLEAKFHLESHQKLYAQLIARLINSGIRNGRFEGGNGDKILKRLIGLAVSVGAQISDNSFREILYSWPGLRDLLLRYWSSLDNKSDFLKIVIGFLLSGQAVDDLCKILITTSLVSAKMTEPLSAADFGFLLHSLDREKPFELYCRLWLISRFRDAPALRVEIDQTREVWSRHRFLSRTVAGFYGLFRGTPAITAFEASVRRWGGADAVSVLEFHERIGTTAPAVYSIGDFIGAPNGSLPVKISHSKTLMLMSIMNNGAYAKFKKAKLLGIHHEMMDDVYYRERFSVAISALP